MSNLQSFFFDPIYKEVAPFDTHGRGVRTKMSDTEIAALKDATYERMKTVVMSAGTVKDGYMKYTPGEVWELLQTYVACTEAPTEDIEEPED